MALEPRGHHAWIGRTLRGAAWAPMLVVVAYAVVIVAVGAAAPPWLDKVAHAAGGLAMAYFGFIALNHLQERVGTTPRAMRLVGAVGFAAVIAIAWEIVEYLADRAAGTRLVRGLEDTLLDLAFGLAGALAFALAVPAAQRARARSRHN